MVVADAWWTWLVVGPVLVFAVVLVAYAAHGWLLFLLGLLSALVDLLYSPIRYGRFVESNRTRRLLDH